MQYLKKHWYLVVVTLLTIGLAVLVLLTSGKLSQTKQVTPTDSRAAAPACTLAFNITVTTGTPTPTPTGTITPTPTPTETPTPTPTSTPTGTPTVTPTPTPPISYTPTPTPTTTVGCNSSCTLNTDCISGLVCIGGSCRNASCTSETSCVCPVAEALPTPKIPVSGGPSILGAFIIAGGLLILSLGLAL